jgi:hypothetical protein
MPDALQVLCLQCTRSVDYTDAPPSYCPYCGSRLPPPATVGHVGETSDLLPSAAPLPAYPAEVDVPAVIGGYRLGRRLGGGGMGSVYEAEDPRTGRPVAVKLILPKYARSPEALERFRREGRLAGGVAHPRSVFVLAADEDAGRPYIVMERMPGRTLHDLVRERGPLPPDEAIARILDVIDGLSEAHRLGVVHRDVKPSNCFLTDDGRVKIGDFGLARALTADAEATQTGTFLGTPLYASPEQARLEPVDAQSDVYSVAATLYYLLTGRAPHQGGDAVATLARVVSTEPPPPRALRPELPRALERAVVRGLARDRRRRYRDLGEFRSALLTFVPAAPTIGGVNLRFAAFLIDVLVLMLAAEVIRLGLIRPLAWAGVLPSLSGAAGLLVYGSAPNTLLWMLYFGVWEGTRGWTVGKRLLRLRVAATEGTGPPGLRRGLVRAGVTYLLTNVGFLAFTVVQGTVFTPGGPPPTPNQSAWLMAVAFGNVAWIVLAAVLVIAPMRAANGYRGLHELVSRTRTYRLGRAAPRRRTAGPARPQLVSEVQPDGLGPGRVGPFQVLGVVAASGAERVVLAEDPHLGRRVWLWDRPAAGPRLTAAERDAARATRLRWVAGGVEGDRQWDAFLAPEGAPLSGLIAGGRRLAWAEARAILEDLADELAVAAEDGTLPVTLALDQVWVQPDGGAQLVGFTLPGEEPAAEPSGDQSRVLAFLQAVAVAALEGSPRPPGGPVRAPVPVHAAAMLDRLTGTRDPYRSAEQFRADLRATRDRPTEVTRLRRLGHLALTLLLLHIPLFGPTMMLLVSGAAVWQLWRPDPARPSRDIAAAVAVVVGVHVGLWTLWDFAFRGGYLYWRGGIALRRADGRKAARWQCGLRALLVWAPVGGLICLSAVAAERLPQATVVATALWLAAVALLTTYPLTALRSPARGPHDRLAGTYLVPE